MQAGTALSPETIAALGIASSTALYPAKDSEKLGIDMTGPEYLDVQPSDFLENPHG